MADRPNIVFFFTDDQRFDTIGALGHPIVKTPNIDRIVASGTAFTQAHIPCGTSGAVCMPSRAMLHTGRTLFHLDREGQEIPAEHRTLGEHLQSLGYHTYGIGKWHNGPAGYARSFSGGDEIFFGGMWDHWNVPACHHDPTGRYETIVPYIDNAWQSNQVMKMRTDHITQGKHSSELFGDAAVSFLRSEKSREPFFLYVSFMAPHDPRSMPERFREMYDPAKMGLPPNFASEHAFDYGQRLIRDETLAPYPRRRDVVCRHIAEYYAMISHLDHEVGRVLNELEQSGRLKDTLIVFAGDNGLALGQHGLFGKQNNYEHSVRVPLVFAGPGVPVGEKRETFAYLLDIYPTLCDLLGAETPETVEGESLVPALENPELHIREELYFALTDSIRSVKDRRYKLIEYASPQIRRTQLFDLEDDPWEKTDLSAAAGYRKVLSTLRERLRAFRDSWDDREHPLGTAFWRRYEQS